MKVSYIIMKMPLTEDGLYPARGSRGFYLPDVSIQIVRTGSDGRKLSGYIHRNFMIEGEDMLEYLC